jgi:hypothetical protein
MKAPWFWLVWCQSCSSRFEKCFLYLGKVLQITTRFATPSLLFVDAAEKIEPEALADFCTSKEIG